MEGNVRNFGALLRAIDDGQLESDLSKELRPLITKLKEHAEATMGKARGQITLTIKLNAAANGTVGIEGDFKVKEPTPVRGGSVLWITKDGGLATENPRQTTLPLRDVSAPAAAREVPPEAQPARDA